jgi:hypothetical protein
MGRLNSGTSCGDKRRAQRVATIKGLQGRRTVMITVSHMEGPDPYGVDPLAADELRVGCNNKPATGNRMPRRPWCDRSREGAVGSEETICSITTNRRCRVAIPGTKGALLGKSAL